MPTYSPEELHIQQTVATEAMDASRILDAEAFALAHAARVVLHLAESAILVLEAERSNSMARAWAGPTGPAYVKGLKSIASELSNRADLTAAGAAAAKTTANAEIDRYRGMGGLT